LRILQLLIIIVAICSACGPGRPVPANDAAAGRQLYATYGCAACHGAEGRGDGPAATMPKPRDFRIRSAYRHGSTVDAIATTIQYGAGAMPAFPYIPENERREIAVWVHSLAEKGNAR
jgi:high-affinity iron transporter